MSILANETEKAAIQALACCSKHFDKLAYLNMTAEDVIPQDLRKAKIKSIVENNKNKRTGEGRKVRSDTL